MLNKTKIELELISGADMYLFFKKEQRGGVCNISKIYNKANIKYLKSNDPKQESQYIIYLEANNLNNYEMIFQQAISKGQILET